MKTPMERLKKFHKAAKVPRIYVTYDPDEVAARIRLRESLIAEEFIEAIDELSLISQEMGDEVALAKELADLLVVVYGTAEVFNIPLDDVFKEVMKSNMSKTKGATWRADGKLLKGKHYRPPNILKIFMKAK